MFRYEYSIYKKKIYLIKYVYVINQQYHNYFENYEALVNKESTNNRLFDPFNKGFQYFN